MTAKKAAATPKNMGRKTKSKADSSSKTSSSSSSSLFFTSSLPGIILATGVAFWYQYQYYQSSGGVGGGGKDNNIDINKSVTLGQQQQPPPYFFTPKAGSWEDGYYSSPIAGQNYPSTHAKLYPNGGIGEPTDVQFASEEDFLSTGRLYNEFGQIVQNRFHFENGTA